ncbi:MAG: quinolinate synthase [Deltaproteobacteria bacterium CG11_big_fil_rev_8_21_14_0_20_42_23]|nr:MAG: quinolinate synthase [Deltaproteobacteria bacterium CG11_big_fil_rev_8_21_14_0_20_42_23]PJC65207.1 MAG: quinolinate synthase [Deltaproteobacteria bacterium CG_4_9_14_0_2_um_filter_42_21]
METANTQTRDQLIASIQELKRQKNAVILAHYYQEADVQDIADVLGDSLALAQAAKRSNADVILFCGVHFMAETAKIVNPGKTVLLPDLDAGCSLAASCDARDLAAWKKEHPEHKIISYINCSAEVKALSDIICTSSNAAKVVASFPKDTPLLFAPDKHLGSWLVEKLGRKMELWPGACHVHEAFRAETILDLKLAHPSATFICHPECSESVRFHAEYVGSTSNLLQFVHDDPRQTFIVGTEVGILHQMQKANPSKTFIAAPGTDAGCNCSICPYMKLNTLEKIYAALRDMKPEIVMDADLLKKAALSLNRMLELS